MVIYRPGRLSCTDLGVTLEDVSGVTGEIVRFLFNGSQYVLVERDSSLNTTELNYWDTDGSRAASHIMSKTNILDVYYDAADDRYYALRWNNDSGFTGTPGYSWGPGTIFFDDFSSGDPDNEYKFDPSLWVESYPSWTAYSWHSEDPFGESYTYDTVSWFKFVRNPRTEVFEYKSSAGRGVLRTTLSTEGDFQAYGTVVLTRLPDNSTFSFRMVDSSVVEAPSTRYNNLMVQASMRGPFDRSDPNKQGRWQSAHTYFYDDNTAGKWFISDFRLLDKYIDRPQGGLLTNSGTGSYTGYEINFYDRAYIGGEYKQFFRMDQISGGSAILASGVISNSKSSFSFVDAPFAFSLRKTNTTDLDTANLVGSSIRLNVRIDGALVGAEHLGTTTVSGIYMGVGKTGTSLYARRDDDAVGGAYSWQDIRVYNLIPGTSTPEISVEVCGDCSGFSSLPDITMDGFIIESTASGVVWDKIPCLSVEVYDTTGSIYSLPGVSDSDGYMIRRFNVINYGVDSGGSFSDIYNQGIAAITTDQRTAAQGGCVYIVVKRAATDPEKIYRFKKSVFPLTALEAGAQAEITKTGSMDYPSLYRRGSFNYNGFSGGHISYEAPNWADPGRGFFVSTMLSGTLSGTNPRRRSWLQPNDYTAWNITDFDSLYGLTVTGTQMGKIYLYNMTPSQASFCNVVSRKRSLDAGTGETSQVSAQVMNVYGEPLSGKLVSFTISAGDGAVSPASALTNVSGEAFTTYTVGTAVTTSTITAAVNI